MKQWYNFFNREYFLLLPSWLAMFWLASKAQWFWRQRPDLQFGWVVLILCIFLFLEAWDKRPLPKFNWISLPITFLGITLLFLMQIYQAALGMNAAMVMGVALGTLLVVAGNLLYVYGLKGLIHFIFPYAFILIALPLPGFIHGPLVNGLQVLVSNMAAELLNLFGVPAIRTGSLIELPVGVVGIAEACSGIRSLQSTLMVALFISYMSLRKMSLRIILVGLGVAFAIFGNLVRTLYLCIIALKKGVEAVNVVHDSAGWSILAFTTAGIIMVAWLLRKWEEVVRIARLKS